MKCAIELYKLIESHKFCVLMENYNILLLITTHF